MSIKNKSITNSQASRTEKTIQSLSFGMWCHVVWYKFTKTLEEPTASCLLAEGSSKMLIHSYHTTCHHIPEDLQSNTSGHYILITDIVLSNIAENNYSFECEDPSLPGCYVMSTGK